LEALSKSYVDSTNLHLRHEVGGWIYQRPDSTYFAVVWPDSAGTSKNCKIGLPGAPFNSDGQSAGKFHVHPHQDGEKVYGYHPANEPRGCPDIESGKTGDTQPYANGGGSVPDWGSSFTESPLFTIAPGKKDKGKAEVFYLNPQTGNTKDNPYRYEVSRATPSACHRRLNLNNE
jgi:hypothetical protein